MNFSRSSNTRREKTKASSLSSSMSTSPFNPTKTQMGKSNPRADPTPVKETMATPSSMHKPTCSSTMKNKNFPAHLHRACPYRYCSLNGQDHLPSPLKSFISSRRRLLKTHKALVSKEIPYKGEENSRVDFPIEIYSSYPKDDSISDMGIDQREEFPSSQEENITYQDDENIRVSFPIKIPTNYPNNDSTLDMGIDQKEGLFASQVENILSHGDENIGDDFPNKIHASYANNDSNSYMGIDQKGSFLPYEEETPEEHVGGLDSLDKNSPAGQSMEITCARSDSTSEIDIDQKGSFLQSHEETLNDKNLEETLEEQVGLDSLDKNSPAGQSMEITCARGDSTSEIGIDQKGSFLLSHEETLNDKNFIQFGGVGSSDKNSQANPPMEISSARSEIQIRGPNFLPKEEGKGKEKADLEETEVESLEERNGGIGSSDNNSHNIRMRGSNFLQRKERKGNEKVDLRHQEEEDRRNSEEWMMDFALRKVVDKLALNRRRKVELLVEAFETVLPSQVSFA